MRGTQHRRGPRLDSPRLELGPHTALAPLRIDDAPALFRLIHGSRAHLMRWLPWVIRICDVEAARTLILVSERQRQRGRCLRFGIWHHEALAGVVTLAQIQRRRRSASLGYWLDQRCEGLGLVSASAAALCRYGREALGLCRIEISTAVDNERSRRVAERLGFQLEGVLRCHDVVNGELVDQAMYSLTARDPLPPVVTVGESTGGHSR